MIVEIGDFDAQRWNDLVVALPGAHVLQSWEWGQLKAEYGWRPFRQVWYDSGGRPIAAAQVLQRTLSMRGFKTRLRMLYVPKGPLLDWSDNELRHRVLGELALLARRQGAIFIKIDPDVVLGSGIPGQPEASEDATGQAVTFDLRTEGWRFSGEQVQFRNTMILDLKPNSQTLLANMKQKTRYNIRLAERKGVIVRSGGIRDLNTLYRMYAETSLRDGFVIREEAYYLRLWESFIQAGLAEALVAEVQGQAVAGLLLFRFARKAWFLYGMSSSAHREKMPSYLLQWEAIKRARVSGCEIYDLWGAPDEFIEEDPLWGVYRFKEGFCGQVIRHIGAWDLPIRPYWYTLYAQTLPKVLEVMRWRGKSKTRRTLPV